ncbi:integrase catalytic domain-containing protein [Nephila pilipes]|uniref:Integrase catalytic domain-containing protein n=1 Tax=Nephila pilipes TaxID=299642 RepID=A0A8X6T693_NEPPI|nr:integrase catalytic domain-containing protein [Nephila pilipes]
MVGGSNLVEKNPESWPVSEVSSQPSEVDIERRKCKIVNMNLTEDPPPPWYAERASDYDKIIRVFAWVLRFINNCKLVNGKCKNNELSQSKFEISEKKLICLVQSQYLSNAKFLNSVVTFVDDEGILRVKTKISNRDDESSFLYPILLPDKC